jgi:gamma-glutamyltranspeptidase/glutathione hydrolase
MVCAVDHLAAQAGVAMLRAGGTAADAAVATSAVLAVTAPHLCGMGGDLWAVVTPADGPPVALDASGRAGSGADADRLRAEGHRSMPLFDDVRSVTVPGCVDGWLALHERFGTLALADVLEPARVYAAEGFPASPTLASSIPRVAHLPEAADLTAGGAATAGTTLRRPGVARALADIVARGRDGFYGGEFGEGLRALGAGEFTARDLAEPLARWVDALRLSAFGHDLWTAPPSSQGYLTLASAFIASGLDLPRDPRDASWAHLLIEASRQAAHDRLAVLHEGADAGALLDPTTLAARRGRIDPQRAATLGDGYGAGDTIALCAVDRRRMGVSLIQSNASGFGSHLIVPGVRIFLHNRGLGFSLEPGHPARYAPGARPPHTLSPLAVTGPDGALRAVAGTMGGDAQPQILLQLLARWLVAGEAAGDAVAAGRWALTGGATGFDTWARHGDDLTVEVEGHAPGAWVEGLRERGHRVERTEAFSSAFGHAQLITVEADHLAGGTDPRPRFGAAAGL